MTLRSAEIWRPPALESSTGLIPRIKGSLRRFFDLQSGSIWNDVQTILPHLRGSVLDVGCGAQPYRQLLSPDVKYIGIDKLDSKDHFGYEVPDARYFTEDRWPVDDSTVDFALCTEAMEHVPEPSLLLNEAFRCLVNGGTLMGTVPFAARWHFIPHDYWRFTPTGLAQLLGNSGFTHIRVYARGNAFTVGCYKVMALLLRLVFPQNHSASVGFFMQLCSLPFLPLLVCLAVLANLSMRGNGGDDCLGYAFMAQKPSN